MKIDLIVGTRPNFVKMASIIDAIYDKQVVGKNIKFRLIHTGQHYDKNMSESFFKQLNIPEPDINFGIGSGSQAEQTSGVMLAYEKLLLQETTDICLVVGDVTSTMACAIVAQKAGIPVAHVEGGIRSNDWTMPEEINRMVTDSITNYFFTTSHFANKNLLSAGVPSERIFFVGNTMIDTLVKYQTHFKKPIIWDKIGLEEKKYIIVTLHRPSNVDDKGNLKKILNGIITSSRNLNIIFPTHPRTSKILNNEIKHKRLYGIEPLNYLEFNYLVEKSKMVITDSGGVTEETTYMGIPCITLRDNTERPETIYVGTNELIGTNPTSISIYLNKLFDGQWKKGSIPDMWDGKTAKRIINNLLNIFDNGTLL